MPGRHFNHSEAPTTISNAISFGEDRAATDLAVSTELTSDYRTICDMVRQNGGGDNTRYFALLDAIARVDSYIVSVTGGGRYVGERKLVRIDEVERSDGHRTTREIVEHPGAVAILAWDGERLAMVRQWRHATGQVLLEIPAGTLEPDEPPAETAQAVFAALGDRVGWEWAFLIHLPR